MSKVTDKPVVSRWANSTDAASTAETIEQARTEDRRKPKWAKPVAAGRESAAFTGLAQVLVTERPPEVEQQRYGGPDAWTIQYRGHTRSVDLNKIGIDAQAVECMPAEVAMAFDMIPLRSVGSKLLAAVPRNSDLPADEVGRLLGKELQLVWADATEIRAAIELHYGVKCTPA
jgi:hypothetical protein